MISMRLKRFLLRNGVVSRFYQLAKGWYVHWLNRNKRRQLHLYGGTVFSRIHDIMSRAGYAYFANYGTLLGIVRDGGYVKNDDDIDLSISAEVADAWDVVSLFSIEPDFVFNYGYAWENRITEINMTCCNISIDFFFQYIESGVNYSHWYDPVNGEWTDENGLRFAFRRAIPIAKNIRDVAIFGTLVPVPGNAEEILQSCYGNWQKPMDKNRDLNYEDVRPAKIFLKSRGRIVHNLQDVKEICQGRISDESISH